MKNSVLPGYVAVEFFLGMVVFFVPYSEKSEGPMKNSVLPGYVVIVFFLGMVVFFVPYSEKKWA